MEGTETDEPHATYLQYVGISGGTADCVEAVERILLTNAGIQSALILTDRSSDHPSHALLLTAANGDQTVVKSGFASGYGGSGPKGFSALLHLLRWHGVELDEVVVDRALLERLDGSALTVDDLEVISSQRRVRPRRLWEYILDEHASDQGNPWRRSERFIPLPIIDDRLATAARDFWSDPDAALMKGHRLLEESIRERAGISIEEASGGPAATYRLAFNGEHPRLSWPGTSKSEHVGRVNLFMGALNAYRHVRAHRSDKTDADDQLCELLLLNQLFRLEAATVVSLAVPRSVDRNAGVSDGPGSCENRA